MDAKSITIPKGFSPDPMKTAAEWLPGGEVEVRTNDPAMARAFRRMLSDPRCEWRLERIMEEGGSQAGWVFKGPAALLAPRLRRKPAPAKGFAKGNPGRRGKAEPDPFGLDF